MSRMRWTPVMIGWLRRTSPEARLPELTARFNRTFDLNCTESQVKAAMRNHRIISGRPRGNPKGTLIAYTEEQAAFIRSRYREVPIDTLTDEFNARFGTDKSLVQIRAFTRNHAIRSGRTGRFEKGHKTWNAGTKGVMKPNSGSFYKGQPPPRMRPVGHERICSKDGYILVKVAEANPYTGYPERYRAKHLVVWEQAHGPVPDKHVVIFVDGDKTNCALENLRCVHRRVHCWLNKQGLRDVPAQAIDSAIAMARVRLKIVDRVKGAEPSETRS